MPSKSDNIIIEHTEFDQRIKLSVEQKKEIIERYHCEGLPQRKLAKIYGVDRRLISFIINPVAYEENLKRRAERGGTAIYYDKEKHRGYMKSHRRYKNRLHREGLI